MNEKYHNKYRIQSNRLETFDYGSNASFFVTICIQKMKNHFGKLQNDEVILNDLGRYAKTCWNDIPKYHPYVVIDEFIVMTNHVHGIIHIAKSIVDETDTHRRDAIPGVSETRSIASLRGNKFGPQSQNLASIIRGFKSAVTMYARKNNIDFKWQSNYHERIIRDERELQNIQQYIIDNPRLGLIPKDKR